MGHNLATWKTLEDMMIELKKKGVSIPSNILEDLRAAKSMIELSNLEGSHENLVQKIEEYLANVEAYLVTEGQKTFDSKHVDRWLQILEEASTLDDCEDPESERTFVVGVPRDQKWVRIEPTEKTPTQQIIKIADENKLKINNQKDGRLLVYGTQIGIKNFLKQMTTLQQNKTN